MHAYEGVLQATPFFAPARADAKSPPFRCTEDYAVMDEFAHHSDVPVLVTYQQYYDWVAGLVRDVTAHFHPDGPVLVELPRPLGVPMPGELLAQPVLISDNISREVDFWRQTPVDAFCEIRVRVRRDRHDFGENSVRLALHSRRECAGEWEDFIANSPLLAQVRAGDKSLSVVSTAH